MSSLCEAYHLTLEQAMRYTMPQIVLMMHASKVNMQRQEERRSDEKTQKSAKDSKDPVVMNGKRLSELSSEELAAYYRDGF